MKVVIYDIVPNKHEIYLINMKKFELDEKMIEMQRSRDNEFKFDRKDENEKIKKKKRLEKYLKLIQV